MGLKRTPLYDIHKALNAKLVDFGGWEMPVQYTQVIGEHVNTRERAGLFDVSHMGELRIAGAGAGAFIDRLITNDIKLLKPGKVIYSPVTNDNGGVVDDLLVYMKAEDEFLLVVNAGNTEKDYDWFKARLAGLSGGAVTVENLSEEFGQIALQGPLAQLILQKLTEFDLDRIGFFCFAEIGVGGRAALVSRTGYTGEDGFEIYCDAADTAGLWGLLMEAGAEHGIMPVGLGARDTLRFEAALPLYGHELADDISPVESGLKYFVRLDKADFVGKAAIEERMSAAGDNGRRLAGIELLDKGVPRDGYRIEKDGTDIGYVTSGTHSPTLKKGLAMAFIPAGLAKPGTELDVVVRGKRIAAKVVKLPFYRKKTLKRS